MADAFAHLRGPSHCLPNVHVIGVRFVEARMDHVGVLVNKIGTKCQKRGDEFTRVLAELKKENEALDKALDDLRAKCEEDEKKANAEIAQLERDMDVAKGMFDKRIASESDHESLMKIYEEERVVMAHKSEELNNAHKRLTAMFSSHDAQADVLRDARVVKHEEYIQLMNREHMMNQFAEIIIKKHHETIKQLEEVREDQLAKAKKLEASRSMY